MDSKDKTIAKLKAQLEQSKSACKKEQIEAKKAKAQLNKSKIKQKELEEKYKKVKAKNRLLNEQLGTRDKHITFLKDELEKDDKSFKQVIKRHKYPAKVVNLCVEIYTRVKCGFRSVADIISIINEELDLGLKEIPNRNSIENWVKKCGLGIYNEAHLNQSKSGYSCIVDESMMIGSQKMLVTLGVDAEKSDSCALAYKDVEVLNMSVRDSWNSQNIASVLQQTAIKKGEAPKYIISDNASSICKAVRDCGYTHIHDIGHTIGMYMERVYKADEEYISFMKVVSDLKFREVMNKTAYLLAPKQRTIARFMNQSGIAKWAYNMLRIYKTKLSEHEREVFSPILRYASLIEELYEIATQIDKILKVIKTEGFSERICQQTQLLLSPLMRGNERTKQFAMGVEQYIKTECQKVPKGKSWNSSSDIIESLFGTYKSRKSPNALHGVTTFALFMPLRTKIGKDGSPSNFDSKKMLEKVRMRDIENWRRENLSDNPVVKRIKILQCA